MRKFMGGVMFGFALSLFIIYILYKQIELSWKKQIPGYKTEKIYKYINTEGD